MRLPKIVLFVVLAMFLAPIAQAQCLLCGVVGFMLGSNSVDGQTTASNGNVMYIAPRIAERLSPEKRLVVRIASTVMLRFDEDEKGAGRGTLEYIRYHSKGRTLHDLFGLAVTDSGKYEILEVMRIIDPQNITKAVFWFAYIETHQLIPLEKLPPPMPR